MRRSIQLLSLIFVYVPLISCTGNNASTTTSTSSATTYTTTTIAVPATTTTSTTTTSSTTTSTKTTIAIPASARFKYSFETDLPIYCSSDCGKAQITYSGGIVPNANLVKSDTRGFVDITWSCRDCRLTVKNLDPDYPIRLRLDEPVIEVDYIYDLNFDGDYLNGNYVRPMYLRPNPWDKLDITLEPGKSISASVFPNEVTTLTELGTVLESAINSSKPPRFLLVLHSNGSGKFELGAPEGIPNLIK